MGGFTRLRRWQAAGEIRQDIDVRTLAFEINALLEGTVLLSVLDQDVDLERTGRRLFRNLWKQISNP